MLKLETKLEPSAWSPHGRISAAMKQLGFTVQFSFLQRMASTFLMVGEVRWLIY